MTTFAVLFLFCVGAACLIGSLLARLTLRWMVQRDMDAIRNEWRWMQ